MSQNNTSITQNNQYNMTLERARGENDRQGGASSAARDAMEAMNPMNVLNGIADVLGKVLGALSG